MTATTDRVTCPACNGIGSGFAPDAFCRLCFGSGSLSPDAWDTETDPARLVRMLGGVEKNLEKMTAFQLACRAQAMILKGYDRSIWSDRRLGLLFAIESWLAEPSDVPMSIAADFLRCLFSNPLIKRERVECKPCKGTGKFGMLHFPRRGDCYDCQGSGSIEKPRIDTRWLTDGVRGLVRNRAACGRCNECIGGTEFKCCHRTPNLDLMPLLADALGYAGCDDEEMLNHCRAETHVGGCWVVELLQAAIEQERVK